MIECFIRSKENNFKKITSNLQSREIKSVFYSKLYQLENRSILYILKEAIKSPRNSLTKNRIRKFFERENNIIFDKEKS